MTAEIYACPACGQIRLRTVESVTAAALPRRDLVCGGEGLERANGGQTHEWTRMELGGFTDLTTLRTTR